MLYMSLFSVNCTFCIRCSFGIEFTCSGNYFADVKRPPPLSVWVFVFFMYLTCCTVCVMTVIKFDVSIFNIDICSEYFWVRSEKKNTIKFLGTQRNEQKPPSNKCLEIMSIRVNQINFNTLICFQFENFNSQIENTS